MIKVFKITGLTPLLQNNPKSMGGNGGIKTKKHPAPEEDAENKVYRMDDGQIYIPSISFRSSVIAPRGGATAQRIGKSAAGTIFSAGVMNADEFCRLYHPETSKPIHDYEIDIRRVVVQKNGILRARPKIPEWGCDLPLEIDDNFLSIDDVLELLNRAGKIAGVGDYRPQSKGIFGRFKAEIKE
jgi:hypothetical protein